MGKTGRKNKKYSPEFKLSVIMNMRENHLGYRRILAILKSRGNVINHKTVLKLINELNIKGKQRKNGKYHSYKGEVGKVADNLLKRDFTAAKPFEKLTTDVTEFKLTNGTKAYLSAIIDLYDNSIVSYVLGHSNNNKTGPESVFRAGFV